MLLEGDAGVRGRNRTDSESGGVRMGSLWDENPGHNKGLDFEQGRAHGWSCQNMAIVCV